MFGHQDSDAPQDAQNGPAPDGALDGDSNNVTAQSNDDANNQDQGGTMQSDDNNGGYMTDGDGAPAPTNDMNTSTNDNDATTSAPAATSSADNLLDIKQQALQQLSPLLGHLDQSPEEKFRTTMMLIQASDNDSLIKTAYDAAQQIPDEKVKAQALLDVINEINYFTHQSDQDAAA